MVKITLSRFTRDAAQQLAGGQNLSYQFCVYPAGYSSSCSCLVLVCLFSSKKYFKAVVASLVDCSYRCFVWFCKVTQTFWVTINLMLVQLCIHTFVHLNDSYSLGCYFYHRYLAIGSDLRANIWGMKLLLPASLSPNIFVYTYKKSIYVFIYLQIHTYVYIYIHLCSRCSLAVFFSNHEFECGEWTCIFFFSGVLFMHCSVGLSGQSDP